ncbi:MAG: hypothetical protein ACEY3D_09765 [Rickettsia sp.]|uniref:hypothetical protein n=1 Tax=Rickettsia sp. TaxID=789 RepID=UPI00397E6FE0
MSFCEALPAWIPPRHCEQALLRRPVKSNVSPRGLTTGSIKTIKNTNNFSIFNWIPWSIHGMTEAKLIHATTHSCESRNDREYQ